MIKFNNVIENFNTVYENRNSPENPCFLNPSLELVKDKAEKASFFDIVDALQSRRWETEETTSETSKAIKKLWLQAKFIYDNEPFSIRSKSKLISLFDQSITEGSFLDQKKLEIYSKQVQIYCELLYLCKLITSAEERLADLSEKIGRPANLEDYSNSLEQKYVKVLAFQKTPTFQFLKNLKHKEPLSFLSVFIDEEEGQIINTYPELLELFELAEYAPIHSKSRGKKEKVNKQNCSSQALRKQMFSILKKTPSEELTISQNELLAFTYSFFKDSTMSIEDYQKYTKTNLKTYKDGVLPVIGNLTRLEKSINDYSEADILILNLLSVIRSSFVNITKEMLEEVNPVPIYPLYPITKIQNIYIKTVKRFIENFKRIYTPLKNKDPIANITDTIVINGDKILNVQGSKGDFLESRLKRFGSALMDFLEIEEGIISEHFPTLSEHPDYLSKARIRSQVKREAESIDSVYSILTKELSKIALSGLSSQQELHTLPIEYKSFFIFLGVNPNSLPSSEELVSLNLKHPSKSFFSTKDIETFDKLIVNFEDLQRKVFQQKMETYCKEYISLKSTSLEKPQIVEEESFVSNIISPKSAVTTPVEDPSPVVIEEELPPIVKEQKIVTINQPASSTGTIPKHTRAKKLSSPSKKQESTISEDHRKPIRELNSLKNLSSVRINKKISKFHYHKRVNRWISDPKAALRDPAYRNLTKTTDNQKETLAFHTFPKLIDSLIETNYCQESEYTDKQGKLIKTYDISGMILIHDIQHVGYFSYAIDSETGQCFHRCFNPDIKSSARDQSFTESQCFSHGNLDIQVHSKDHTIQIHDSAHDMEIYIYPITVDNE